MTIEKAREAVAQGVEFLDTHGDVPGHWRELIDTDMLNMGDDHRCVLAQLTPYVLTTTEMAEQFGNGHHRQYVATADKLFSGNLSMAGPLGFFPSDVGGAQWTWNENSITPATTPELNQAWREALAPAQVAA